MEVRILGPLEVLRAGSPLALGGTKQRSVFAMLALRVNRVVSIDFLVDGLWGSAPPTDPVNVVQVYVSRLRKVLRPHGDKDGPDGAVLRRAPGYLLQLDPEQLDLYCFERLAGEGRRGLPEAPDLAAAALGGALDLWRGRPLAEFAEEPFARRETPRLEELRLNTLSARIQADLLLGRHAELVGELEGLTVRHPLNEGLLGQLILTLYRSGRQAEALDALRRARKAFADELGIELGRELRDLEAAVLTQDPQLDWTPPVTPVAQAGTKAPIVPPQDADPRPRNIAVQQLPQVSNIPSRNPRFTGRAGALDQLHHRMQSAGQEALVVQALYGLGGVGKTQLAIEYAHRHAGDYNILWWVDAEQPVLIPNQLAELAGRLGLPAQGSAPHTAHRVLTELGRRADWLLIFDNAGHPESITGYLPVGKRAGRALVTSRFPAWGALGGRLEVDVLERKETVALLRARIPEMTPDIAEKIAAELGDLPLAAAQAAAYLEQTGLPATDYLRRFRTRRAALMSHGDVLGYQGRVDTTWALSLERLRGISAGAAALLELSAFLASEPIPLSLFTDHPEFLGEPLRTVAADPDTVSDDVGAAVELSLVRRHPDGFQLHRLVQAVIRQQLPAGTRDTMSKAALSLLSAAHPGDPNDPAHWGAYARLSPHVLATSTMGDDRSDSRQLVRDTISYLFVWGDSRAACVIAEELLDRWRRVLGPDQSDCLQLAASLAVELAWLGDADKACALGDDTHVRAQRALGSDHPGTMVAAAAAAWTVALTQAGPAEQACRVCDDALRRCRDTLGPNHLTTLLAATALTLALSHADQADRACDLGAETVARCRDILGPNHRITLAAAAVLSLALSEAGSTQQACNLGEDTLHRCRDALGRNHPTTLTAAAVLTLSRWQQGHAEQACSLGEDTLQRCRDTLGPNHLTTLLAASGLTLARAQQGHHEQACRLGAETVAHSRETLGSDHPTTLFAAAVLTLALTQAGQAEQARGLGEDTVARCRTTMGPDHRTTLAAATVLTLALTQAGDAERAYRLGEDTVRRCRDTMGSNHPTTLIAAGVLTVALTQAGHAEQARRLGEDTVRRCRDTLGPNHPTTLRAAAALAAAVDCPDG